MMVVTHAPIIFFQESEQSQMVGSIANRAITDLICEGNTEGLRNFLESRKSHVDDKDEVMSYKILHVLSRFLVDSKNAKAVQDLHVIVKAGCMVQPQVGIWNVASHRFQLIHVQNLLTTLINCDGTLFQGKIIYLIF